ncbi:hypothetical protein G6M89_00050 [Natronolimnobius sp. AArcel1]|uniref:hypothetical protein n=1 Tax=Natronolimnobius sp. AArcel1 TaxID=1679093 RepID=UPI0013EC8C26|nr:hypothetical protein [Natronolimnobius sp. AArcel1]NGM67410.1 hypothetical protein [Natronolimnobius sp. AArcel1]
MSDTESESTVRRLASLRDRLEAGMDRREFLRTLVTGGYAVGMAHFLGVEDFLSAADGEVPVVTAVVREDPSDPYSLTERTQTVPADWYAAVETATELNDRLARLAFTGYLGSAVVPGSYDSATASVSIGLSSDADSIPEAISAFADDISINPETFIEIESIEEGPDPTTAEPRFASHIPADGPPSGVACETSSSMATLSPALYDPTDEQAFFATAEHAFEEADSAIGERVTLPVEGGDLLTLGAVEQAFPVEDIVAVSPDDGDGVQPSSWIDAPEPVRVTGQLTKFGLADLIARDEELEKVGALTGHTTGRIQGIDAVTCFTDHFCRRGQIRWGGEMDLTDGDSGSVSYYPDPEGADDTVLVAGLNNARTWWPGQSYVWGVSAYHLTEMQGYHF